MKDDVVVTQWSYTVDQLWHGSVLASIAHAMIVSRHPELANEQSWDGVNYSVQDSMGSRGTVSFSLSARAIWCVGTFFGQNSERKSLIEGRPRDPYTLFGKIDERLKMLLDEALQYLLDDFHGDALPWITSGFWSYQGRLVSLDSWETFHQHGGHLIQRQLLIPIEVAVARWQSDYKMRPNEASMMVNLYSQRISRPDDQLVLTPEQRDILDGNAIGIEECRESFREIGIIFP